MGKKVENKDVISVINSIVSDIKLTEIAKNKKREELKNLYNTLNKYENFFDILILQIAKDIEEKFSGVKFRIIARIKSYESFLNKMENDLLGLENNEAINSVKIYDIFALSIIIEEVPDNIKANDSSFDDHMNELINHRKETKDIMKEYEEQIEELKNRLITYEKNMERNEQQLKINKELLDKIDINEEVILNIKSNIEYIKHSIKNIDELIEATKKDIENRKETLKRTKEKRYNREDNDCNNALADYITKKICTFDNVKKLNMEPIEGRLKKIEKYNGYKGTHNCLETAIKAKDGTVYFCCEIQGKSLDSFYIADRGKAAKYHIKQEKTPGHIIKEKILPEVLNMTEEQSEEFIENFYKKIPKYKIYGQNAKNVYKFSKKEAFMTYYMNQLFGNKELDIPSRLDDLKNIIEGNKINVDDGEMYEI